MLKIKNVSLAFGEHQVLDNLNLEFKQGQIIGLVAPNGTGKSTLINVILHNLIPQRGEVEYDSLTYSSNKNEVKLHKSICAFPDQNDLFPYMTGRDHLKLYADLWHNSSSSVNEIISQLQMASYIDKKTATYSLGMKQRLCFAMVVAADTSVMLLDEIMNGLDPQNVSLISDVLIELKRKGKLLIMASHLLQNLQLYADRVLFLKSGHVIQDINLQDNKELYLKLQDSNKVESIIKNIKHLKLANGLNLISLAELDNLKKEKLMQDLALNLIPYKVEPISLEDLFEIHYGE
ncbi:ABC-2 type transport system ATP-binding protein [Lactobacillus colini]|uniref:ABC-2 type transport system ATP-binding protein n=1 Tax=Lactobacillus colini TaxID=1819254 RepID=A0ABS4MGW6_9LACO|nr:ABC transporter ATP-binding protein [Lactobacillus colini]MBP2058927.1 ABC-2 type transport system ATP-binding protein [Lactobacillus colini]